MGSSSVNATATLNFSYFTVSSVQCVISLRVHSRASTTFSCTQKQVGRKPSGSSTFAITCNAAAAACIRRSATRLSSSLNISVPW